MNKKFTGFKYTDEELSMTDDEIRDALQFMGIDKEKIDEMLYKGCEEGYEDGEEE